MSFEKSPITYPEAEENKESDLRAETDIEKFAEKQSILKTISEAERQIEESKVQERNLAQKIFDVFKKRGTRLAQITTLMSAMGLSGCYESEKGTESAETEPKVKQLSGEEREQILRETGVDIVSLTESLDWSAEVQVPSTSGQYILHIGQIHYIDDVEKDLNSAKEIIRVQKEIEQILITLTENGVDKVFNEGYISNWSNEWPVEYRERASKVIAGKKCFEELTTLCHNDTKFFEKRGNFTADYIAADIKNIYRKRAFKLVEELKFQNMFDNDMEKAFEQSLSEFQPTGVLANLGNDAVYLTDASRKLANEGVITILPAETKEAQELLSKTLDEREKASDEYLNAIRNWKNFSEEEIKRLKQRYDEIRDQREHIVFDNRDNIAINKIQYYIKDNNGETDEKIFPLIYGMAHDFKDNLLNLRPDDAELEGLGLIRIHPRRHADVPREAVEDK